MGKNKARSKMFATTGQFKNLFSPGKWRLKGKSQEEKNQENTASTIKKDATTSIGLLQGQYDKLSGPDSMIMQGLDFEQESNRGQHEQQNSQLAQSIGKSNLAGSGGQTRARQNLAQAFQSKQSFTRKKALDEQDSALDRLTMEMQNIISSTNASLAGMGELSDSERDYDPGDLSYYGL